MGSLQVKVVQVAAGALKVLSVHGEWPSGMHPQRMRRQVFSPPPVVFSGEVFLKLILQSPALKGITDVLCGIVGINCETKIISGDNWCKLPCCL